MTECSTTGKWFKRLAGVIASTVGLIASILGVLAFFFDRPRELLQSTGRTVWTDRYPALHLWLLTAIVIVLSVALAYRQRSSGGTVTPLASGDLSIVDRYVDVLEGRAMGMMRTFNFHSSFETAPLNEAFYGGNDLYNRPENTLIDDAMRKLLEDLISSINNFMTYMSNHTSPNHAGRQSVYPSNALYAMEQEERYEAEADELNRLSTEVAERFDTFVTEARRRGWTKR